MRVLVDPVFAQRCSPVQFMGPARYTRAPATVAQLLAGGPIDVVAISHSHYDHLCVPTLSALIAAADAQHPLPVRQACAGAPLRD
jgi:L-ascorbate metabolism protein UlaG (beta-lactamase superfamily)